MADVFISYSRRDKDFVAKLHQALDAHGKQAWVDWEDIPASAAWVSEIHDGIDAANAFLFVLSPDSVGSEVCQQELEHAIHRRKRILPILHREVDPQAVHPEAAALNWVFLRDQDSFEQGLRTLLQAIDTDLDHVKAHTRLAGQAINWERGGHDRARLLRGSELETAERWLIEAAGKQPPPTELQAQFLQAGRDAARRRGRIVFGAVALALVVAVALAIVALIQRSNAVHQSKVAYSRELDANAQNQYTTDPELSVLLAVQAAKVAPGPATREALRMALAQSHVRDRYTNTHGAMGDALWSPDGTRLLIAEEGADRAEIVRPGTGTAPVVLRAPGLDNQIGWDRAGRLAITGASQVQIWNGTTGALVRRLPTAGVSAELAPDGRSAATIDLAGDLHIWDVRTGRQLGQTSLASQGTAACLKWSPDGSVLLACMAKLSSTQLTRTSHAHETLDLLDGHTGHPLATIAEPHLIHDVAFSPDSNRLAVAALGDTNPNQSGGVIVYSARTGTQVLRVVGAATAVAFSPSSDQLAYATLRGSIAHVYTFADHSDVPLVGHTGSIQSIAFSHSGVYVVTGAADNTARVFNSFFGTPVEVLYGHTGGVTDATLSADDSRLATASADGTARVWATPVPHPLAQRPVAGQVRLSVSPQGDRLAVVGSGQPSSLLDTSRLATLASLRPPPGERLTAGGFSPDGRWLAALASPPAGSGNAVADRVVVYDARSGQSATTISGGSASISQAVFAGSGRLAVATRTGQVALYALPQGARVRTLVPAGRTVQTLDSTPDGSKFAVTHPDGSIDVLDASGARLRTLHGPAPQSLYPGIRTALPSIQAEFSPNGEWLASSGGGNTVRLWDVASGRQLQTLAGGISPFISLAFSPDNRTLAAGNSASAHVWQIPSGAHLRELVHADPSTWGPAAELSSIGGVRLAFSHDGGTLVTSGDLELRAWNPQSGEQLFESQFTNAGQGTPNAQYLFGLRARRLVQYGCDLCGGLDQLLATAARDTTRGLTPGERALYLHQS